MVSMMLRQASLEDMADSMGEQQLQEGCRDDDVQRRGAQ